MVPDMSIFGKGMANGFSQSALAGKREVMRLRRPRTAYEDVFLLSTTHGAETSALIAATTTMEVYRTEPVIEHLHRIGARLAEGLRQASTRHGLSSYVGPVGRACNLFFSTLDPAGRPSQPYRTLFLQELIRRGVLGPSFVVSYSHQDEDIDRTIDAIDGALRSTPARCPTASTSCWSGRHHVRCSYGIPHNEVVYLLQILGRSRHPIRLRTSPGWRPSWRG